MPREERARLWEAGGLAALGPLGSWVRKDEGADASRVSFLWAGRPHPARAPAGAHPAPQQLPGLSQRTRTCDQAQMVLATRPLLGHPSAWAALPGANR